MLAVLILTVVQNLREISMSVFLKIGEELSFTCPQCIPGGTPQKIG